MVIALALAAAAALGAYALAVEPRRLTRTFLSVTLRDLAVAQRALAVGDLHLRAGSAAAFERIRGAAEWAHREGADTAFLLGDLIERDDEIDPIADRLAGALRPLRAIYVSGNHELDRSHRVHWPLKRNDAALIRSALASRGIECADGRAVEVGPLHVIGLPWQGWRVGPDPAALAALPRVAGPSVLLTHSPDHVVGTRSTGISFALCGHTHGGQVRLPVLGAPWTPTVARPPRAWGAMTIDGVPTFLTRGLSATFPVRLGAPPEVVLVEFAAARGRAPEGVTVIEQVAG
jgi:predicted MPP superfamily phosphohydrolase